MAAYAFDEGAGTTVSDASGNRNTGAFAAGTWTTAGKFAGAASLDGTSARVNVPDAASLDMTAGLTLEAWVRPAAFAPSQTVIAKERAGGGFPYGLELDNGVPTAYITAGNNAVARSTSALPLSTWSFVAASYDGSSLRVYVNGAQVASTSVSGALSTSRGPLSIGADTAWGEYVSGSVDNVRVYDRALSATELQADQSAAITTPVVPAPTPAAAYAFDEGSSSTSADASGNGHTLTLTGVGWAQAGKYAGAASFDGASSLATTADGPSLDPTSRLTLEAWVKPTAYAASQTLVAKERTGGGFPWGLELDNGVPTAYVSAATNATARGAAALTAGSWSFVAATYDGSTLRVYVNGTQVGSAAVTGALATSAGPLSIGADAAWGEHAYGAIDNVRIYGTALTAAQLGTDAATAVTGSSAPLGDTTPPSAPAGLALSTITQTSAQLNWNASTDNVAVTGYDLYLNGTKQATTSTTTYTYTALTCATTYTFGAAAHDAAGNTSITTTTQLTTAACPTTGDTTPPTTPTGLTVNNITQTSAQLNWNASTDNVAVTGYNLSRSGTSVATVTSTTYAFTGLTCGTSYTLGAAAHDAAGNTSGTAATTATTAACSTGGSTFYVDPAATGARNGSSWGNAWTSFASINWSSIAPGATLYLSGGPSGSSTTYTTALTVGSSGTSTKPVTIAVDPSDAAHNGTAVLDFAASGTSSTVTGIDLGSRNYVTISGAGRLRIQNIVNTSAGTSGVGVAGSGGNTGIMIDGVAFNNVNNGVQITSARGNTIQNSTFTGIRGDAAVALAGSTGGFDSTIVRGNTFQLLCLLSSNSCAGPDGIQSGSGVTVANNTFTEATTTSPTSDQHPDTIQNQGDYLKAYGNDFVNVGDSNIDFDAFADATPHDVWVFDNLFHVVTAIDPYPDFFRFYRSGGVTTTSLTNFKLWNNVFADDTNGGGIPPVNVCYYSCSTPTGSGNEVTNNLFVSTGTGSASSSGASLYLGSGSFAVSHNVFARTSGTNVVCLRASCSIGNTAISASVDATAAFGMPGFVRYAPGSAANDFHLTAADTVARDTGSSLSAFFATDKDGVARPQGGAWDRGPYER